jgi:hypothetical protein
MYRLILIVAALAFSGCAVQKHYGASGGSKSDGTVKMSYTYGLFDKVTVDENAALVNAIRRCKVWGYQGAESFDFVNRQCQSTDGSGNCNRWIVTKEFQCND